MNDVVTGDVDVPDAGSVDSISALDLFLDYTRVRFYFAEACMRFDDDTRI